MYSVLSNVIQPECVCIRLYFVCPCKVVHRPDRSVFLTAGRGARNAQEYPVHKAVIKSPGAQGNRAIANVAGMPAANKDIAPKGDLAVYRQQAIYTARAKCHTIKHWVTRSRAGY